MSEPIDDDALAWKIEADALPGLTFTDYRRQLIHETAEIADFFNDVRGRRFIISAPKGFGKTLLLIAKRMQIDDRTRSSARTMQLKADEKPSHSASSGNEIVDRPIDIFPFLSHERIEALKQDYAYWKNLWKLAIMASVLKAEHEASGTSLKLPKGATGLLHEVFQAGSNFKSASTIFVALFTADHTEQIESLRHTGFISRAFQQTRTPSFLFIDNVDEYFKPVLEQRAADSPDPRDTHYRSRDNAIWTLAQIGLVGAAYEFHKANSHVKVYCTVRREAFAQLGEYEDQLIQIRGCCIEIDYQRDDFRAIFDKNVGLLTKKSLAEPEATDPLMRFFGKANIKLRHKYVDQEENPFEFVLRHTFYRPRDLMVLGAAITRISPKERTWEAIKRQIDDASHDVVDGLRSEMRPFFVFPALEKLAKHVSSNVMDMVELQHITKSYVEEQYQGTPGGHEQAHPFCVLSKIGMVGRIRRSPGSPTETVQEFAKPRDITMKNEIGLPATEKYYLIHPALDHDLASHSQMGYLKNFHSQNIIGNQLPWSEPNSAYFVLKGDVCGFSEVMKSEYYESLSARIHEWAASTCSDVSFYEVSGGDSIVIIDKSPERAIGAARDFIRRARAHKEFPVTLRFGGAAGPVFFKEFRRRVHGKFETLVIPLGLALRTSARLEPHAPVGGVLVEEKFQEFARGRVSGEDTFSCASDADVKSFKFDAQRKRFTIQKNANDPPYETSLWVVRWPN